MTTRKQVMNIRRNRRNHNKKKQDNNNNTTNNKKKQTTGHQHTKNNELEPNTKQNKHIPIRQILNIRQLRTNIRNYIQYY